MNAIYTRLRFLRHFYQMLLKFNRGRDPPTSTISCVVEEVLKSCHVCREALNSSLQTTNLGVGYGKLNSRFTTWEVYHPISHF